MKKAPFENPDWWRENESDGKEFFGYDDEDGTTTWYEPDGSLDNVTPTPSSANYGDNYDMFVERLRHLSEEEDY